MWKEFKEFAIKGNVMDMAVGIIIGAAFTSIVQSLVKDVIMPPIGLLTGGKDYADKFLLLRPGSEPGPYLTLEAAEAVGAVTINYGLFINAIVSFLIVAFAVFLVVRYVNRLRRPEEGPALPPSIKSCPYCMSDISIKAVRCPQCTSDLEAAPAV